MSPMIDDPRQSGVSLRYVNTGGTTYTQKVFLLCVCVCVCECVCVCVTIIFIEQQDKNWREGVGGTQEKLEGGEMERELM